MGRSGRPERPAPLLAQIKVRSRVRPCDRANRKDGGQQTAVQTAVTEIPTLIRILLWTDPLADVVIVTAVVAVVAIGAVRTRRGGRSDCRSPVADTWAVIAAAVAGVTRDWTARATGYGSTCDGMRGVRTSGIAAASMKPASAAVNASGMHATATEAAPVEAAASAPEAASSASASIGFIWDQACGEQNEDGKSGENTA
jgi:hypothetical protein